jgi:hypothetical protein
MVDTPRKTFPELQALTAPVVDSDVLAVYRSPGPAKRTTASVLGAYVNTVIGTAFTRTLLDDADAATARATLAAVGTTDLAASTGAGLVGSIASGTGAVARTVQVKLRDAVRVEDYGAVGDGTTNDTVAIQAAIDAVSAAGGGVLNFGPKTYIVTNTSGLACLTAKSNVTLLGSATTIKIGSAAGGCAILYSSSAVSNISVEGITFDGNNPTVTTDTRGIRLENVTRLNVDRCVFQAFRQEYAVGAGYACQAGVGNQLDFPDYGGCWGRCERYPGLQSARPDHRRLLFLRLHYFAYRHQPDRGKCRYRKLHCSYKQLHQKWRWLAGWLFRHLAFG